MNIPDEDRTAIQAKEIEKFAVIIDVMKKHKLLDTYGQGVYEELHKLRKYRNKVHIQDDVKIEGQMLPRDEDKLFSDAIRDWSLKFNSLLPCSRRPRQPASRAPAAALTATARGSASVL